MSDLSRIASSGMAAQQRQIDVLANNISNSASSGYKQQRVRLQDQPYRSLREVLHDADQPGVPSEWRIGEGVDANASQRLFWQGELIESGNALDVAIVGPGFFQVQLDDGSTAYTRDGAFTLNADRQVVTKAGHLVLPGSRVPEAVTVVTVGADGGVWGDLNGEWAQIGAIDLATFANPGGLLAVGQNLFQPTAASGDAQVAADAEGGFLQAGVLEGSNVDLADQMTRLIQAQRAYQANLKAFQTWDELLSQANDLRRG